ncbi:MAG: hypothetical protein ACXWRE_10655 [Pseudobdellovibrionaceae bacterium]
MPAFYLDFDWGTQVVNVTPTSMNTGSKANATPTLIVGDDRRGYMVSEYTRLELGAGAAVKFWVENSTSLSPNAWAQVGLIPYAGSEANASRFAPTRQAIKNLTKPQIPQQSADLNSWNIGDQISYTSKGGVFFFAGVGYMSVAANVNYLKTGLFITTVKKVADDKVIVQIANSKITGLSKQVQAALVAVGNTDSTQNTTSLSFVINYKDDIGGKIYEDLIRGNAAPAQLWAQKKNANIIQNYEDSVSSQKGNFNTLFFGLPIVLNRKYSDGDSYDISKTNMVMNNQIANVEYNVYLRDVRTRALDHHMQKTTAFYGASYNLRSMQDNSYLEGVFGQFVLNEKDDQATTDDLRDMVSSVIKRTGLQRYLGLKVPTLSTNRNYADVSFKLTLSNEVTMQLLRNAQSVTAEQIAKKALDKVNAYAQMAARYGDYNSACSDPSYQADATVTNNISAESLEDCLNDLQGDFASDAKDMLKALTDMRAFFQQRNAKSFNKAYSAFGKALTSNQFMFLTGLELMGAGADISYIVKGHEFAIYDRYFKTTAQPGVLESVARPVAPVSLDFKDSWNRGVIVVPGTGALPPVQSHN